MQRTYLLGIQFVEGNRNILFQKDNKMKKLQITPDNQTQCVNESEMTLPLDMGRGGVKKLIFNTGIRLSISNYKLHSDTLFEYSSFPAVFGFGFCLSGDIYSQPADFKDAGNICSGQSALFCFNSDKMSETVGTRQVVRFDIIFEPNRLQDLFGEYPEKIFPDLHRITHSPRRIFDTLTPAMRSTIIQILDCPYQGLTRKFFLESKVLELVAYKLDQLSGEKNRFEGRSGLKDEDVDKTKYASQLMTRDLENPPSFSELGRQVGMCRSKLHQCFREVYGMTPFDYLRYKRLETAERLLRQGELNVTQTAYAVGYSSLSHFAKAFQQHIGYLPGQYQKKNCNKSKRSRLTPS